jgi:hypothetical protein
MNKDSKIAKRVKTIAKCMQTVAKQYLNYRETVPKSWKKLDNFECMRYEKFWTPDNEILGSPLRFEVQVA